LNPGQTSQWSAQATFSDSTSQNITNSAAWSSANTSVATVNSSGVVTAVAAGTADIRISYQGLSQNRTLTVVGVSASFRVIPNADTNLPSGQCAVGQVGSNNLFRCRFDATASTPTSGITEYRWEVPVGGNSFSGSTLQDITVPCGVGNLNGSGAIDRQIRLTVTAPACSNSVTNTVTFIRASAC